MKQPPKKAKTATDKALVEWPVARSHAPGCLNDGDIVFFELELEGGERVRLVCHHSRIWQVVADILAGAEMAAKDREAANPIHGKPQDREWAELLHGARGFQ